MGTILKEVYDAFKEAGVSEEKASQAAAALTQYEERFQRLEQRMIHLEGRMSLLQWMVGTNIALTIAVLFKLLL